jgi:ABC-type lipoprotein release transport system permease subunit
VFLLTYLRRELRRRLRQSLFVSLGLALGIGLIITVTAVSNGVKDAQGKALASLYGVGTDITVTTPAEGPGDTSATTAFLEKLQSGTLAPGDSVRGNFVTGYGTEASMAGNGLGRLSQATVSQIARLPGVAAAAGGLTATNLQITATIPAGGGGFGDWDLRTSAFQVGGVDVAVAELGPLTSGELTTGRALAASDIGAAVAVVDSGFATEQGLGLGSNVTIAEKAFEVIGIVAQPPGATPAAVYIPLAWAQRLTRMADDVNTIYVAAESASDAAAVSDQISRVLPNAQVTSSDALAGQVSGSLSTATRLADDIGRWLAVAVLVAAFTLACLLTLSAVSRRAGELGLLKALGWQSRRVIGQVTGEALGQGLAGAALGLTLGVGATALIAWASPSLSATVDPPAPDDRLTGPCPGGCAFREAIASSRNVGALDLSPQITPSMIVLGTLLALAGALIAGALGGWRAARLRPAIALRRVG